MEDWDSEVTSSINENKQRILALKRAAFYDMCQVKEE
jgi:hypothetical protein